jgi:hypothetical protein
VRSSSLPLFDPIIMKSVFPTLLVGAGLFALVPLSAAPITIVNGSFEDQTVSRYAGTVITGWNKQNSTPSTQWYGTIENVSAGFTSGLSGNNALWLSGTLTQLTSATYVEGVTYTLTFDLGNPNDVTASTSGLTVGFRNDANITSSDFRGITPGVSVSNGVNGSTFISTETLNAIPEGTFQSFSVSYTATLADAGQAIRIGATDYFNNDAVGAYRLDNFQLSDSTVIPEPSTYAMVAGVLGLGLAAGRRRRELA